MSEAAAAIPATPANFSARMAAADAAPAAPAAPSGQSAHSANDNAIPDRPVQIQDEKPGRVEPESPGMPDPPPLVEPDEEGQELPEQEDAPPEGDPVELELQELRQLKAAIEGDEWPDALLQKPRKISINGEEYYVTAGEAFQGYMRNSDYSRKLREVSQHREYAQRLQTGAQNLLRDLNDPSSLLAASKELGFRKALVEAAKVIAKERYALSQLPPEARAYALQLEEQRDQAEALARQYSRLEQEVNAQKQEQPDARAQRITHQLEQLVPRAFKKHNIGDYPLAIELFQENIHALYEGGEVSPQLVDAAAQATAENLADIAKRLPATNGNGNGHRPLPVQRAAVANGKPVLKKQGGTASDFRARFLGR